MRRFGCAHWRAACFLGSTARRTTGSSRSSQTSTWCVGPVCLSSPLPFSPVPSHRPIYMGASSPLNLRPRRPLSDCDVRSQRLALSPAQMFIYATSVSAAVSPFLLYPARLAAESLRGHAALRGAHRAPPPMARQEWRRGRGCHPRCGPGEQHTAGRSAAPTTAPTAGGNRSRWRDRPHRWLPSGMLSRVSCTTSLSPLSYPPPSPPPAAA